MMNRNIFGNVALLIVTVLIFAVFTNIERSHHTPPFTTKEIILPALYHTALFLGGCVCVIIAALQWSKKYSAHKPNK